MEKIPTCGRNGISAYPVLPKYSCQGGHQTLGRGREAEEPCLRKNSGRQKFDSSLDEKFQRLEHWIPMEKPWQIRWQQGEEQLGRWFKIPNSGEQSAFLVPFPFSCAKAGIFLQTNFYSLLWMGVFIFLRSPTLVSTNSCKYSKHPWFQKLLLQLCFPSIILETEDINAGILPVPRLHEMKASLEKNICRYLFPSLNSSFQAKFIHGEWQETK